MGSGGGTSSESSLTKFQKPIARDLGTILQQGLAKGGAAPWGVPTAPLQPGEQNFFFPQGPGDELFRQSALDFAQQPVDFNFAQYLPDALSGLDVSQSADLWRQNVFPEQQRLFQEEILPNITEGFDYWSSPRQDAERIANERFATSMGGQLQNYISQRESQALGMLPTVAGLEQSLAQEPLRRAGFGLQAEEIQRQLRTQELNARLQEFIRIQPEASPWIERALAFLNTPMMMTTGQTGGSGLGSAIGMGLGAAGGFLIGGPPGAIAGAGIGGSIGGSF